jgi:hypothetical protein
MVFREEERVQARRRNFETYRQRLGDLPGIEFMPEAAWGCANRRLTVITVDPGGFGKQRDRPKFASPPGPPRLGGARRRLGSHVGNQKISVRPPLPPALGDQGGSPLHQSHHSYDPIYDERQRS